MQLPASEVRFNAFLEAVSNSPICQSHLNPESCFVHTQLSRDIIGLVITLFFNIPAVDDPVARSNL